MNRALKLLVPFCLLVASILAAAPATAAGDIHSKNMTHIGYSGFPGTTNSDLAFRGHLLYAGTYKGPRILDISDPRHPKQLSFLDCNGGQGDVTLWRNLLFVSVDRDQTAPGCKNSEDTPGYTPGFEGIRIIDVSDPTNPRFIKAVPTDCGSHTNTLMPGAKHRNAFLYIGSYPLTGQDSNCNEHHYISVVKVPANAPRQAKVVSYPDVSPTQGCHDINVFLPLHIAAAACLSEGQIWDVRKPAHPVVLQHLYNPGISIWHSAVLSWDGKVVAFSDENQSYQACRGPDSPTGAIWFYRMKGRTVADPEQPDGWYALPREVNGADTECTAHNSNVIPVKGRYILVAAFYYGGATVVDFTNPAKPKEVAYYQIQGKVPADEWSTYWYNGYIYSNDINRGVDVFKLNMPILRKAQTFKMLNPQVQTRRL